MNGGEGNDPSRHQKFHWLGLPLVVILPASVKAIPSVDFSSKLAINVTDLGNYRVRKIADPMIIASETFLPIILKED
jgi:hypothetical protein